MYLKSSIQTSSIEYKQISLYNIKNIKQYTNSIYQKYNNKYMTPIHQNNLGTKLFLSLI